MHHVLIIVAVEQTHSELEKNPGSTFWVCFVLHLIRKALASAFYCSIGKCFLKEARAGCGLKKRLRDFFFIFAYVIFMVFRVYLCAKNHTSP